jgi:MFS family permease
MKSNAYSTPHTKTSVSSLGKSRLFYLVWMFVNNVSFGIITQSYFSLFSTVLDKGGTLLPSLVLSFYSVTSLIGSPIAAAVSDHVGRKSLFVLAAATNTITGMIMGLVPVTWVFSMMVLIQGAGDNSFPVGYALLADCVISDQLAFQEGVGGDDRCIQGTCALLGASNAQTAGFQHEVNAQFTLAIALQSVGLLAGQLCGTALLSIGSPSMAMTCSGVIYLPLWIYASAWLSETLPAAKTTPQSYWKEQEERAERGPAATVARSTQPTSRCAFFWYVCSPGLFALATGSKRLFYAPRLRSLVFLSFLVTLVQAGTLSSLSTWGTWMFGWSALRGAVASQVLVASGLFGAVVSSRLARSLPDHSVLAGMICLAMVACVPCGLVASVDETSPGFTLWLSLVFVGFGLGCQPLILAMIANEAMSGGSGSGVFGLDEAASSQGLVQGLNYAFSTIAMGIAPYSYRYVSFYASVGSVEDDDANLFDEPSSSTDSSPGLFWWVSAGLLCCGAIAALGIPTSSAASL